MSKREEIASLYTKYGAVVGRRCRYLLKDEEAARDATQEVFVRILRSSESYRGDAPPVHWILRIATNHCLNLIAAKNASWHGRFRRYRQHVEETRVIEPDELEKTELVRRLLARVDRETQVVAVLYFVDEMTQQEIAESVGRSLPTVRKRIEKFLRIAKKELGHELA